MSKIIFCLFLVSLLEAPTTSSTVLADIFNLIGSMLNLLSQSHQGSTGRAGIPRQATRKEVTCFLSTRPNRTDNTERITNCNYCDQNANKEEAIENEHLCAQMCKRFRCSIYKDDEHDGCLVAPSDDDVCQCGPTAASLDGLKPDKFVIPNAEERKQARNTSAGCDDG